MFACLTPSAREAALRAEIDLLRAQLHALLRIARLLLGNRPLPLTDDERRHIVERAHVVGWRALRDTLLIAAIGTLRGWFRTYVEKRAARKRQRRSRPGRPQLAPRIRRLVVKLARRNATWGYDQIANTLANLDIHISDTSVGNILRSHGVPTAPERQRRSKQWKAFLATHWQALAACDFLTVPVVTLAGFRFVYVLVVIQLATRRIHFAAVTMHPDSVVMQNVARSLTMDETGFLTRHGITHLIHDGDGAFTQTGFVGVLAARGVTSIRIPPRSPNCNAYAERVILSIQRECTDRIMFVGDRALRVALAAYERHYHQRRNHQGIGGRIIDPGPEVGRPTGEIVERSQLGGLLRYYERVDRQTAA